ncbi:phage tail assembly protein T [Pectobacterium carotovorum]|uniref:phage tail assembly protein T n=1 Tax=Pectobacterium carotovorum TaxID=554 RepID=UPI0029DA6585|nr:phage tail assembly protein T [Pectobacterium carotovorum]MDX6915640.1 phage tail assembly protein T [Pectobacterium carotovorum]
MRLAREFRRPDWRGMLAEISATEFMEWIDFFGEKPFMDSLIDAEFSNLTATIVTLISGKTDLNIDDFSLFSDRREMVERTDDELMLLSEGLIGGMRYEPTSG